MPIYTDKTILSFLEETSSKTPLVPSCGSVLALCAALSAALTEFVANVTIEKKGYESIQEEMAELLKTAKEYRNVFTEDIDNDAKAYTGVIQSFKMPKNTNNEKSLREKNIDSNLKKAALVPLNLAENTLKLLEQIVILIKKGNKNAIGDAKAAYIISKAVIEASINNVEINCSLIKDKDFIHKTLKKITEIETRLIDIEY